MSEKPKPADRLEQLLCDEEGAAPYAYQDHLGYWTIGIGRLIDSRRGGGLSNDEMLYLLRNDISSRRDVLKKRLPVFQRLDPVRQSAVIALAFQLGVNGFLGFRKTIAALEAADYAEAARELLDSTFAKQTPARAKRMAAMLEKGEWP